jgi:hypothetical protein
MMDTPPALRKLHEYVENLLAASSRNRIVTQTPAHEAKDTESRLDNLGPLVADVPPKDIEKGDGTQRYHSLNLSKMRKQRLEDLKGNLVERKHIVFAHEAAPVSQPLTPDHRIWKLTEV